MLREKNSKQIEKLSSNHFLTGNDELWDEKYSMGYVLTQISNWI